MVSFINTLLTGICSFLASVLPDSPFSTFLQPLQAVGKGLAWLNWFFPVGDCLTIFAAWLVLLLLWAAADFSFRNIFDVIKGLVHG